MGKNDNVLIQWVTKDKWNGVKQNAKRKDIKPEEGALRSGQEVKLKWSSHWYNVIVCEDWSPKKRKANSDASVNKENVPASDASKTTATDESERYQQFLEEQNTRVDGWGEERRKRLVTEKTAAPNVRPHQKAVSSASPIRNPAPSAPKEVPIAVVPPSPLKRERELHSTLHAAKKLKEELEQERATLREEFKRKDEELKRREEQIQANISNDVRKVLVSMQESLLTLTAQVNAQFQSLTSSVDEIQKKLTSMEESMTLSSMLSLTESAESLRSEPSPEQSVYCPTLERSLQTSTPQPQRRNVKERTTEVITPDLLLSYGVPHHLIGETIEAIQQCDKRHLLALKLVQHLFSKEELSSSNCGGNHGKGQLDGRRLDLIKRLTFFVYPVEVSDVSKTWSDIKNKINNKCRYLKKQTASHLSSADPMVENVTVL